MKNIRLPGNPRIWLPLVILFILIALMLPRSAKFNYDYKKGSPWNYETLIAQFDFPILKTQDQIISEKGNRENGVIPYFRFSEDVVNSRLKAIEGADFGNSGSLKGKVSAAVKEIYSHGVIQDEWGQPGKKASDISSEVLYVRKDKKTVKYPVSEVYRESDAKAKLLADINDSANCLNCDSLLRKTGIYDLLIPNLIYDDQTTSLVHEESAASVSPTQGFVDAGYPIVSKGEVVTAEIARMLDSYKVEYEKNYGYSGPKVFLWLGNITMSLILVLILYLAIYYTNRHLFEEPGRYIYLLMIFFIAALAALIIGKVNQMFLYMVPFSLTALYLMAFFKKRVIVPVYIISLLPLLIFSNDGVILFVMFLVAGMVSILMFKYFNRGWKQFVTAFMVFVSLLVTYFGFKLIDEVNGDTYRTVIYLFVSSLLSVAGYPLIYLFERMFGLVSDSRLTELCDTNNQLLRRLEHVAPGTFQHCLQVMNMSDAVARSIGANALLARTGALYHDIGKMKNPQCFIENESLVPLPGRRHYHDGLSPIESARAIIKHVDDGLVIAEKYKLPSIVSDFIVTHHGTTVTGYFYNKFVNEGGDPSEIAAFRYHGEKPKTKEQIIIMLCDSIEAASRTLNDYSPESFSAFVEKIVSSKMEEGQFEEADISIKELNTIKEELKSYLGGVYHERIVYPDTAGTSVH
ncbi:MAG: HDIG domain-containing protein [Bacteroidales bacterium]|jgi:putative nucleotidyltransferase with HDIG domain|nr:HDIG domain-containing protein [Bacteroidales bacterium]